MRTNFKTVVSLGVLVSGALSISACNTFRGVGLDLVQAGNMVQGGSRTVSNGVTSLRNPSPYQPSVTTPSYYAPAPALPTPSVNVQTPSLNVQPPSVTTTNNTYHTPTTPIVPPVYVPPVYNPSGS